MVFHGEEALSLFISLTSSACSDCLLPSTVTSLQPHSLLLSPCLPQGHALVVPPTWNVLPRDSHLAQSLTCFMSLLKRPLCNQANLPTQHKIAASMLPLHP